jgi:hypothetical protein
MPEKTAIVVGALGVIGRYIERLAALPNGRVVERLRIHRKRFPNG